AKAYRTSLRTRASASKQAAKTVADVTLARQTKVALDEERHRREEAWAKTQEEWSAIARRLKQEARLRLAAAAQDPTTTDAYFVPPARTARYDSVPPATAPPSGTLPGYATLPGYPQPYSAMPSDGPAPPYGNPALDEPAS